MNIPQYLVGTDQERYHQLLNQVLTAGVGNLGFQITNLSAADITVITSMNFPQVLPPGTEFFNTDLLEWQGISVAAVPGVSNAVIKTFTTV